MPTNAFVASGLGTVTISEQRLYELLYSADRFLSIILSYQVEMGGKGSGESSQSLLASIVPILRASFLYQMKSGWELSNNSTVPLVTSNGWLSLRGTNVCTVSIGHTPKM